MSGWGAPWRSPGVGGVAPLRAARLLLLALAATLFGAAHAQIRILQPPELVGKFRMGLIRGSTAGFGTPYWGEQLVGRLVYAESLKGRAYCTPDDYELPPPAPPATAEGEVNYSRIVVVRRGQCHFSTKVHVAQEFKNAAAVIVVDEAGSRRTPADIRGVIMADDGSGATIRIPSVLISDREGSELIALLRQNRDVIVELTWDVPNEHIVEVDHWMSPGSSATLNFLTQFAPFARALKHQLNFKPHFWVFSLPTDSNNMCRDLNGRFCGLAPDWHLPPVDGGAAAGAGGAAGGGSHAITGKMVVEESLRQRCLWEMTKTVDVSAFSQAGAQASILHRSGEYSAPWWDYIEKVDGVCLRPQIVGQGKASRKKGDATSPAGPDAGLPGTADCSYGLMRQLGIDAAAIEECTETFGESYLLSDLYSHAWSPTALMINDARFAGPLDAFVVARAVCTGFVREPEECQALRARPIHDVLFGGGDEDPYVLGGSFARSRGGVAWWVYFLSVLITVFFCLGLVAFYRMWLVKELRNELRYEVFEEVKSQIGLRNNASSTTSGGPGGGNFGSDASSFSVAAAAAAAAGFADDDLSELGESAGPGPVPAGDRGLEVVSVGSFRPPRLS